MAPRPPGDPGTPGSSSPQAGAGCWRLPGDPFAAQSWGRARRPRSPPAARTPPYPPRISLELRLNWELTLAECRVTMRCAKGAGGGGTSSAEREEGVRGELPTGGPRCRHPGVPRAGSSPRCLLQVRGPQQLPGTPSTARSIALLCVCRPAVCLVATRGPPTRVSRSPSPGHAAACLPRRPPSHLAPLCHPAARFAHPLRATPSVPCSPPQDRPRSGAPPAPAFPTLAGAGPSGTPPAPSARGLGTPKDGGAGQGTRCPSAAARRRLSVLGQDGLRVPPGSPGQRHACQARLGEAWGGDTPHLALFTVKPELEGCRWATSQERELASREGSGGDVAEGSWGATATGLRTEPRAGGWGAAQPYPESQKGLPSRNRG